MTPSNLVEMETHPDIGGSTVAVVSHHTTVLLLTHQYPAVQLRSIAILPRFH
jgi:hypothetical protein